MNTGARKLWADVFIPYYRRTCKQGEYQWGNDRPFVYEASDKWYDVAGRQLPTNHYDKFLTWLELEFGFIQFHELSSKLALYRTENLKDLQQAQRTCESFLDWLRSISVVAGPLTRIAAVAGEIEGTNEARLQYTNMANDELRVAAFWRRCRQVGVTDDEIARVSAAVKRMDIEAEVVAAMPPAEREAWRRKQIAACKAAVRKIGRPAGRGV